MECEQVFCVLTSAPFPTGGPADIDVERHLVCCDSCRQIAEALRPCEDLVHEAMPSVERRGLPRYRRELRPTAVATSGGAPAGIGPEGHASASLSPSAARPWRRDLIVDERPDIYDRYRCEERHLGGGLREAASVLFFTGVVAAGGWMFSLLVM